MDRYTRFMVVEAAPLSAKLEMAAVDGGRGGLSPELRASNCQTLSDQNWPIEVCNRELPDNV